MAFAFIWRALGWRVRARARHGMALVFLHRAFRSWIRARIMAEHGFCIWQRALGLRFRASKEKREVSGDGGRAFGVAEEVRLFEIPICF